MWDILMQEGLIHSIALVVSFGIVVVYEFIN